MLNNDDASSLRAVIGRRIREQGPLTTAAFMELALYHPTLGYYTRAPRRTGRDGDFYTSVDVGPQFGALLAVQLDEMCQLLDGEDTFELVEVGAGNGQLARDILDAAQRAHPDLYRRLRVTLVETSAAARQAHPDVLGPHRPRLEASRSDMPADINNGAVLANELLDALPTHAVVMTTGGLREVYVDQDDDRFVERLGPPSTPALADYLARLDVEPSPGWRGEVSLAAGEWMREMADRLHRGFAIVIDYGHTADRLFAGRHAAGTLTTFHRHVVDAAGQDPRQPDGPAWFANPGEQDITAHVDLTSARAAAEDAGCAVLGLVDQTRFLLGLGALDPPADDTGRSGLRHRLGLKTLLVPGGLGSTHQVLLLGKGVGAPPLRGLWMQSGITTGSPER